MVIDINGKQYTLKYSFRALMIYENITQKSFSPQGLSDVLTFFYSVVTASSRDNTLSFDDFIDWIDEHPSSLNDFSNWLTDEFNHQAEITNQELEVDTKKAEEDAEKN